MPGWAGVRDYLEVRNRRLGSIEQCDNLRLGIEGIEPLRFSGFPVASLPIACQQQTESRMLVIAEVTATDLEQADSRDAAIDVLPCGADQARQQRRTHDLHIFADWIGELPFAATECIGVPLRNEAPCDGFIKAPRGGRAANPPLHHLRTGGGRF